MEAPRPRMRRNQLMDGWLEKLRHEVTRLGERIDRRDEYGLTDNERNAKATRDYATELLKQATAQASYWQERCMAAEARLTRKRR